MWCQALQTDAHLLMHIYGMAVHKFYQHISNINHVKSVIYNALGVFYKCFVMLWLCT